MSDRQIIKEMDQASKKRRGYQLKYRLIPKREQNLKKWNDKAKEERAMLVKYKNELTNIQFGLKKQIDEHSFIESLKCPVEQKRGKLPKSWGSR